MSPRPLRIALVGQRFMGRAHSNAWSQAPRFFELPRQPRLELACGLDEAGLAAFAERWGWARHTVRWRDAVLDDGIDLVDVTTPNDLHAEPAIAALEAGKHVCCEKPLAHSLDAARAMRDAAAAAEGKSFVWFNYRRVPAVELARRFVASGALGRIYHVRARYLQSWGGPAAAMAWRFRRSRAGSGAHGDLNAHLVDLARLLTREEFVEVNGAVCRTFVRERRKGDGRGRGRSDVDDATSFLATLSGGGLASFEASRVATGHGNAHSIELSGEGGALRFDFDDMNALHVHEAGIDEPGGGWRRIVATSAEDPWVAAFWPEGHWLGYEHGFVAMAADVVRAVSRRRPTAPLPDFADAWETQRVLEAALVSARERAPVKLAEIR